MTTIFLRYISPVTIAPVIAAIGLGLYDIAFSGISGCWSLGLLQLSTIVIFSQ
jgi:nucleobase transporter 1/2